MPPVLPPVTMHIHRHWNVDSASIARYEINPDEQEYPKDWSDLIHTNHTRLPEPPTSSAHANLTASIAPGPPKTAARTGRTNASKTASNKRAAATRDAADSGAPEPAKKRRKDDGMSAPVPPPAPLVTAAAKRTEAHKDRDKAPEERAPVPTDLSSLPSSALISYLVKYEIIPPIHPSPYTAQSSLAPSILLNPPSHTPPPPPQPSPSRDTSNSLAPERRRSSRFQDDEFGAPSATADDTLYTHHTPILTDLDAVHGTLTKLVERHWHTKSVREQDTIAGFVWSAQRARERTLLAASSAGHG